MTDAHWAAVWVSLRVASFALVLVLAAGVPLSFLLARRTLRGRTVLDALVSLPLLLPPVVTGFALLWLMAPDGWLGRWGLLYRWPAASVAGALVALPLFVRSFRAALEDVDPGLVRAAANLGASPWRVAWTVRVPLARSGLWAGTLLALGRALGEFGATILVAGNIPGRTQTIPLAIFSFTQTGELRSILPLVAVISIASFAMVLLADRSGRRS